MGGAFDQHSLSASIGAGSVGTAAESCPCRDSHTILSQSRSDTLCPVTRTDNKHVRSRGEAACTTAERPTAAAGAGGGTGGGAGGSGAPGPLCEHKASDGLTETS